MEKIRVLFLAASPAVAPLKLDEEIREITAKIRTADYRDSLEVISKSAVRPDDLQQALLEHRPHVLHFSGHGTKSEELVLLDDQGAPKPVSNAALTNLLRVLKDNLRLVVLNACFSRPQAEAIAQVVDCAVGMNQAVGDEAAIKFAAAFYRAIGFGRSIQTAFELGQSALMLDGIPEELTPALVVRMGVNPASIALIDEKRPSSSSALPQLPSLPPQVATPSAAAISISAEPPLVRLIRVFVSSPGDVKAEREVLDHVVAAINRTDGERDRFRLELFKWEKNTVPFIGPGPQPAVDAQTPSYDIYLGIMSTRFGTPTERAGSGTEAEFNTALDKWQLIGKPWIMFYFDEQPKLTGDVEQVKQYLKVCEFRAKIETKGLVAKYKGVEGGNETFRTQVDEQLRKVTRMLMEQSGSAAPPPPGPGLPKVPSEYTQWLARRCGDLELLGLELKSAVGVRLNHVYTPLTTSARSDLTGDLKATVRGASVGRRRGLPDQGDKGKPQLLLDLLDEQSLYVSGDPGSGKSTFCRWVTLLCCRGELPTADVPAPTEFVENFPTKLTQRLPALIALRDFWPHLETVGGRGASQNAGHGALEQALQAWLAAQQLPGVDWPCLRAHLNNGSALLVLDGIDEVPAVRRTAGRDSWYPREVLLSGLAEAVSRWDDVGNRVLVTSRPYGLTSQHRERLRLLAAPIQELSQSLQALLIRRWFVRLSDHPDQGLERANAMIGHLHRERNLDELAANPLLLTAMCVIYDEGKRLPQDKYKLYDRIVDTVLHKRYPADKELVTVIRGRLEAVALGMHTGDGLGQQRVTPEASASDREIDLLLQAYQQVDGSTDKGLSDTVHVREDLLSNSGLLISRDDDRASFYHLSIQEFMAAERLFVLRRGELQRYADLMIERGPTPGWRNTLSFVFGSIITKFNTHAGVEMLRAVVHRIALPGVDPNRRGSSAAVWSLGIALGDFLEVLLGRGVDLPGDLRQFFERLVLRAIDQEIAARDRQTLAVTLGRLGDPRVITDLRDPAAYERIDAGEYAYQDGNQTIGRPFLLSRFPVTNSQYGLFFKDGGYSNRKYWSNNGWQWKLRESIDQPQFWRDVRRNAPNLPVVGVSWWEAEAFCFWAGGWLPKERQWEAAARGKKGYEFPWGKTWENGICNSVDTNLGEASAVGIFPRSRTASVELYDMTGNVSEWCQDTVRAYRVIRGGSWRGSAAGYRASYRSGRKPAYRFEYVGFRVARSPSGQ